MNGHPGRFAMLQRPDQGLCSWNISFNLVQCTLKDIFNGIFTWYEILNVQKTIDKKAPFFHYP